MEELDDYRDVELSYMDHLGNHRYTWDSFSIENSIVRDDGATFRIPTPYVVSDDGQSYDTTRTASWPRKAWKNTSLVFRVELMIAWINYTREHPNVGEPISGG
jgi:hypothetical protein